MIEHGRFTEFLAAVGEYCFYRLDNGRTVPQVLQGLSGQMNAVRLVYSYPDLAAYEQEEARDSADPAAPASTASCAAVAAPAPTPLPATRWLRARLRELA